MTFCGMNDHVRGLVDDGQELILIKDRQGNIFRMCYGMSRFGKSDKQPIAVVNLVARLRR